MVEQIVARTDGVPLFVGEATKAALYRNQLQRDLTPPLRQLLKHGRRGAMWSRAARRCP